MRHIFHEIGTDSFLDDGDGHSADTSARYIHRPADHCHLRHDPSKALGPHWRYRTPDKAIRAHARGFFANNNHNNGIRFAFLLDMRARLGLDDDAVADRIVAQRIRGEVLAICNGLLTSVGARDQATDVAAIDIRRFWIKGAKLQALVGLERIDEAVAFRKEVFDEPAAVRWRRSELQERLQKLVELLEPERETSRRSQLLTVLGST